MNKQEKICLISEMESELKQIKNSINSNNKEIRVESHLYKINDNIKKINKELELSLD